jgi:hypothetical protein
MNEPTYPRREGKYNDMMAKVGLLYIPSTRGALRYEVYLTNASPVKILRKKTHKDIKNLVIVKNGRHM